MPAPDQSPLLRAPQRPPNMDGWEPLPEAEGPPSVLESLLDLLMGATTGGLMTNDSLAGEIGGELSPLGIAGVARKFGKAGSRIAKGTQSYTPEAGALKIPRFRSENGTFVKYQGKWWRLKPFGAEDKTVQLDWMGEADEFTGDVLRSQTVPMEKLIEKARAGNAYNSGGGKVARRKK